MLDPLITSHQSKRNIFVIFCEIKSQLKGRPIKSVQYNKYRHVSRLKWNKHHLEHRSVMWVITQEQLFLY